MRWISLLTWIALCFLVAGLGGRWTTAEIPVWYRGLIRPSIAPPNWIFGPVWTLLYLLMAIAAWLVWQTPSSALRTWGVALFLAQLAMNLGWSWIFFHKHALGAALVEVVLLWGMIGATTLVFSRVAPVAAWLMAPYLVWVGFASVLNGAFWRVN